MIPLQGLFKALHPARDGIGYHHIPITLGDTSHLENITLPPREGPSTVSWVAVIASGRGPNWIPTW